MASPEGAGEVGSYLFWAATGAIAAFLTWLGHHGKAASMEPAVATIRGSVLMDNTAIDPLRKDLAELRIAVNELAVVMGAVAQDRVKDEEKREIRQEFEAERRMDELAALLQQLKAEKKID